jgi:hypothetical protein
MPTQVKLPKLRKKGLYSTQKSESFDAYVVSYKSLCSTFNEIDFAPNTRFVSHTKYAVSVL